jgi:hypothetical protein
MALALLLASAGGAMADTRTLVEAWYEEPVDLYPHRIMGTIREAVVLAARDGAGREYRVDLRDRGRGHNVFEDIAPRLADADGDGAIDVVVVESARAEGAQLAVYGLRRGALVKTAATPHIGTRFRWLAPVAIGDLDGNGIVDLAYVDRPHLDRTLRVWSWAPGGLTEIARMPGLTNHRIGDEVIWGGLRRCAGAPEMVLADAAFERVVLVTLTDAGLEQRPTGLAATPAGFGAVLDCDAP